MRTSKPVSTISYNDPSFLKLKLEELRRAGRISEWYFVIHRPEEDEKKEHIHLYLQPSKMLQTDDLVKEFTQPDPEKPDKVLTCPRWQSSKFGDWYLYAIHDQAYLVSKGQTRKYHYRRDDVVAFDEDALDDAVREIDLTSVNAVKRMMDAQHSGVSFGQFFQRGGVPLNAIGAYERAWELLLMQGTYRADRTGHEEAPTSPAEPSTSPAEPSTSLVCADEVVTIVDPSTGEIYDELPF